MIEKLRQNVLKLEPNSKTMLRMHFSDWADTRRTSGGYHSISINRQKCWHNGNFEADRLPLDFIDLWELGRRATMLRHWLKVQTRCIVHCRRDYFYTRRHALCRVGLLDFFVTILSFVATTICYKKISLLIWTINNCSTIKLTNFLSGINT